MTVPLERTRAMVHTRVFLQELMSPQAMPDVADAVREEGRALLRHYPCGNELQRLHQALPQWFGPMVSDRRIGSNAGMELFSLWGFETCWLSPHGAGYGISANLGGVDVWYWSKDQNLVRKAFSHACRRAFLRRLLPWLAPPPLVLESTGAPRDVVETIPSELTRAILETQRFLERLSNRRLEPDIPDAVCRYAHALLRHYPDSMDFDLAHDALPQWFGPVPEKER